MLNIPHPALRSTFPLTPSAPYGRFVSLQGFVAGLLEGKAYYLVVGRKITVGNSRDKKYQGVDVLKSSVWVGIGLAVVVGRVCPRADASSANARASDGLPSAMQRCA